MVENGSVGTMKKPCTKCAARRAALIKAAKAAAQLLKGKPKK